MRCQPLAARAPRGRSLEPWLGVRVLAVLIPVVGLALLSATAAVAQEPAAVPAPPPALTREALDEQRTALTRELEEARARLGRAEPASRESLEREVGLLETLDLVFEQQLAGLAERAQREVEAEAAETMLAELRATGLPEPPPYPLQLLDDALAEQETLAEQAESASAGIEAATAALAQARETRTRRERARREAKEALATSRDAAERAELDARLRVRGLQSRVATGQVATRELELENARLVSSLQELRRQAAALRAERLAAGVEFTAEALAARLAKLDEREAALRTELAAARSAVESAERAWLAARRAAKDAAAEPPVVVARRAALQTAQLRVTVLGQRIQRLDDARQAWERRFALADPSADRAQLAEWADELRADLAELERQRRAEERQIAELNALRRDQEARIEGESEEDVSRSARVPLAELEAQIRIHESAVVSLDEARRLAESALRDLDQRLQVVSVREQFEDAWRAVREAWRYEVFAVEDSPITVGRLVVGALLLIAGFFFSGLLSRLVGRRLLPRMGLDAGAAAALESVLHYLFLVLLALLALRTMSVPLTAFTLLGGAAAIGLGFGSQNVINNFISGLILFAERPIRVGDMVEIDGTYGAIERIGARSTRVRSFTGIHIIVPNSAFLEKNVVNWTLSDDRVRTFVSVGVAYGSPVALVMDLIRQAVADNPRALQTPEPVVIFSDFGNDALLFEVHFWLRMRSLMDRRRAESDVRMRIDERFRANGVVIAFPQRDVHFDADRPLPVRVLPPPPSETD